MKTRLANRTRQNDQPPTAADEVASALRGEVRRAIGVAAQQSELLQSIAIRMAALTDEIFVDATADELRQHAHELRGIVSHGLSVLSELQYVNGRLESLAAIRRSLATPNDE